MKASHAGYSKNNDSFINNTKYYIVANGAYMSTQY